MTNGDQAYERIKRSYDILAYSDVVYQLRKHCDAPWCDDVVSKVVDDIAQSTGTEKKRTVTKLANFLEAQDLKTVLANSTPLTHGYAFDLLCELGRDDTPKKNAIPYLVEACVKDIGGCAEDRTVFFKAALIKHCVYDLTESIFEVFFDNLELESFKSLYEYAAMYKPNGLIEALVDYGHVFEWGDVVKLLEKRPDLKPSNMLTLITVADAHKKILQTVKLPPEFEGLKTLSDFESVEFDGQNGLMWLARSDRFGRVMEQSAAQGDKMTIARMDKIRNFSDNSPAPASIAHVAGLRGTLYDLMLRPHLFERGQDDIKDIYQNLPRAMQRRYDAAYDSAAARKQLLKTAKRPRLG